MHGSMLAWYLESHKHTHSARNSRPTRAGLVMGESTQTLLDVAVDLERRVRAGLVVVAHALVRRDLALGSQGDQVRAVRETVVIVARRVTFVRDHDIVQVPVTGAHT